MRRWAMRWSHGLRVALWTAILTVTAAAARQPTRQSTSQPLSRPAQWTRAEAGRAAIADLAKRLTVSGARIRIVAESDEVWSDSTFGCTGRKPLDEPEPVPGFAFTLDVDGVRYRYRSDRHGVLRRCDTPKPTAPIQRGGA